MEETVLKELLEKYRLGTCSPEEKILIESWYLSEAGKESAPISSAQLKQSRDRISNLIAQQTGVTLGDNNIVRVKWWPRIAAAASILAFLSVAGYFLLNKHKPQPIDLIAKNDITPGSNSAVLTLGNGQIIVLNKKPNGQLAVQSGMAVTKTSNGQLQYQQNGDDTHELVYNTITTRKKEQYQVVLSDGTKVWLNAASSIKYPAVFEGKDREVAITGEAYFEVAHNPEKPFKVTAHGQTIQVLGTHFNVNAYDDEPAVKTTLLEGSVKITYSQGVKVLVPGEQAALTGDQLSVANINTDEAVAWKNGYFRFDKENITSIMRKVSRWYDVDVQFNGALPDDEFSGNISRFTNISQVLKALEYYNTVHFKIEGRRIMVSK